MSFLKVCSLFLFLPAFVVCASDYNAYILKTPYNFKFKVNDVLNMDIAMLNIPPNVYYFSVNAGEKSVINKFEISRWDIWHIIIDKIVTQNSYHSIQLLLYEKYDSNNACTTVNIAQGQPKNSLRSISEQNKTYECLNDKHCTIAVDFRNSCTKIVPYFKCSFIDLLIICTKEEYNETTFTWQQFYDDGSYIGTTPEITATTSKFIYNFKNFDNNTFVKALPDNSSSNRFRLKPVIPKFQTKSKLMFTDSTHIEFDCEIYLQQTNYVYVGLINTTESKITTLNTTKIYEKYGKEYNGSILCCLYYTTTKKKPEIYVKRYVKNRTLLLYSTEELADSGVTRDLTVLYAVTAAVLILAVAIIIVVIKRCCNKTPTSSEPKPVSKWEPFYENKLLLLRKECDREIEAERQAQEPVYEEIL